MTSPDMWSESDWRAFQWFGVCDCGRLRREHVVRDADSGEVIEVVARCDAGHITDLGDI
jgi:hypothetical protein